MTGTGRGDGAPRPRPLRFAVLGGGTGISAVLGGLAGEAGNGQTLEITAVVATGDDGGSSGRIRAERGGLPPGDLRACLLALSPDDGGTFRKIFAHRYDGAGDLGGHALGNLILSALAHEEGGFLAALETAGSLLGTRGRVLPVTEAPVRLCGEGPGGTPLVGESVIGRTASIRRFWIDPVEISPAPGVEEAIRGADILVLGPGSLYTSLLAVLLVPGVARAVRVCRGRRVLVANLMTQPGETQGLSLVDHLEVLEHHAGAGLVDDVLVHSGPVSPEQLRAYALESAAPVEPGPVEGRPERFLSLPLATASGKVRHDPRLLASALVDLAREGTPRAAEGARWTA